MLTSETFCDSDDDVEEAEQEIEDESEDEELRCSTIKKVMKFGDSRTGTATTVEVREMDLSELHESAVISLALFNYDHTWTHAHNGRAVCICVCVSRELLHVFVPHM